MPPLELLIAFLVTSAIFAFIPGPAMLYAAARTLSGGRRSGLMASLGIHLGGYVHIVAAAAGLSAIFHAVPTLYMAVKLLGAAYLIWLGIGLFRAPPPSRDGMSIARPRSGRRAFIESITIEVLNPKTAIFFLAFLPQFVDASASLPLWSQLLLLGAVVNAMFSAADLIAVALAGLMMARLRRSGRIQRIMQRVGGSILVALGAHLALQER
jgi:threonine/homoserine/homoserine lactone efflux protein